MRVLHVIGVMDRGGAESMIMNIYRFIDRSQIQFDFLVHEQRQGDFDDEISLLGGRIFRLPRFNGLNAHDYRMGCRSLFESHPEWTIVHGHIGSCAAIYLSEAKRLGRCAIAHSHAQNYGGGIGSLAFRVVSYPTRFIADYFFACSREAGLDRFGAHIVDDMTRFSVLANGIDVEKYQCNQIIHDEIKNSIGLDGKLVVCHVGRLTSVKNHSFLFQVFLRLRQNHPNAVLLLAGRGELECQLRDYARNLGLSDSVRFLGVVEDVPSILKASDLFIFPSLKEGLPLAVVEAQCSGLPAVISDGVPEYALVSMGARRMSLSSGADCWALKCEEMLAEADHSFRADCVQEVREHGFDIRDSSKSLSAIYHRLADC